jgi:hypothetical protein
MSKVEYAELGNGIPVKMDKEERYGRPRGMDQYGYGDKITTTYMVRLADDERWRRVYAICYSNVASHYVIVNGAVKYLHDWALEDAIYRMRKAEGEAEEKKQ